MYWKKYYLFVLALAIPFLITSCKKVEDLLTFKVHDSSSFTIPSITGIDSPVSIPVPPVESNSQQTFENNNTAASLVKNVVLENLTLTITDPAAKTFQFLKSIKIYISADGEQEILLAHKDNIPAEINSVLEMDPEGNKLDPYIKKDTYNLRTVVEVKEIPGQDVTVRADMVLRVTADPL